MDNFHVNTLDCLHLVSDHYCKVEKLVRETKCLHSLKRLFESVWEFRNSLVSPWEVPSSIPTIAPHRWPQRLWGRPFIERLFKRRGQALAGDAYLRMMWPELSSQRLKFRICPESWPTFFHWARRVLTVGCDPGNVIQMSCITWLTASLWELWTMSIVKECTKDNAIVFLKVHMWEILQLAYYFSIWPSFYVALCYCCI